MQIVYQTALPLIVLLTALTLSIAPAVAGGDARLEHHHDALEEVVVHVTRSHRGLAEQPTRVEVLAGEELEEKLMMRPGNISMLLNETGGIRVQVTAPSIGAANIRTYGLRGRYTQLLADGLPIYGGQASSENNPYRMQSDPYLQVRLLGELVMGRFSVFVNLENLLDVRQTRKDSLLLPARSPLGLWTVDAWAPLEGFIANVGFRLRIGAN